MGRLGLTTSDRTPGRYDPKKCGHTPQLVTSDLKTAKPLGWLGGKVSLLVRFLARGTTTDEFRAHKFARFDHFLALTFRFGKSFAIFFALRVMNERCARLRTCEHHAPASRLDETALDDIFFPPARRFSREAVLCEDAAK